MRFCIAMLKALLIKCAIAEEWVECMRITHWCMCFMLVCLHYVFHFSSVDSQFFGFHGVHLSFDGDLRFSDNINKSSLVRHIKAFILVNRLFCQILWRQSCCWLGMLILRQPVWQLYLSRLIFYVILSNFFIQLWAQLFAGNVS